MSAGIWLEKAERCLDSARILLETSDTAGACNRAYYAMFNAARAALIAVGQERLSAAKTHAGVISAFGQHLVRANLIDAGVAKFLGQEAHLRLVADYDGTPIPLAEAVRAVAEADQFVGMIVQKFRPGR